ncbi:hypothetical protein SCLARK_00283 [Spiroplasma clarkii]|nr:hypothetical protein [Spiroplasma clarkii]ARU91040.1 hypothetical protein SCLARK_00283 [Spiroplasma clarkii]
MFSGTTGDPSKLGQSGAGSGIGSVINERTVLTNPEFVTNFSTGQGIKYFQEGKMIENSIWNHRGVMDIMPTYQWIIENGGGNNFDADFTYSKAFSKGNALRFASSNYSTENGEYEGGTLKENGTTKVKLFSGDIPITDQVMQINLSAVAGAKDLLGSSNNSLDVKFNLEFTDNTSKVVEAVNNGFIKGSENWYDLSANLSEFTGKNLKSIGLIFEGTQDQSGVFIDLGQMSLAKSAKTENIEFVDDINFEYVISDSEFANIRMYWNEASTKGDRYEIYQIVDGKEVFLGTTRTNAYFLQDVDLSKSKKFAIKNISNYNSENFKTTIRELK